jgi:hypothetical protein
MTIDSTMAIDNQRNMALVKRIAREEAFLIASVLELMEDAREYFSNGISANDIYMLAVVTGDEKFQPARNRGLENLYRRTRTLHEYSEDFFGHGATLNYVVGLAERREARNNFEWVAARQN